MDEDFNYGADDFMDEGMEFSFSEERKDFLSSLISPQKLKEKPLDFSPFKNSPRKEVFFKKNLSESPVFAKRPPSINLDDPTTFSKPKEARTTIPENVPFSELNDEIFGTKQSKSTGKSTVEHEFFGVYCLISRSPLRHFKNRCYIGYTVDPNRRIQQHNSGQAAGGAKKTDNRGPWEMICIVHGFPNSVSALRFEWAWQNPDKSRRLKEVILKKFPKESQFAFRLRIVSHMLNSDPWRRLALTFRWLIPSEEIPFPKEIMPPSHMVKKYGLVEKTTEAVPKDYTAYQKIQPCTICHQPIAALSQFVRCPQQKLCVTHYHTRCLAEQTLKQFKELESALVPIEGRCNRCHTSWKWGDLIQDQKLLIQISEVALNQHRIANAALLIPKAV